MSGTWIGVDLGTSGVKTVLIDETSAVLASATAPLTVSRPNPGWSEQDPDDWWRAVCDTLDSLSKSHPAALSAARGLGLSGQQHGATLIDADGAPIRPCILWNDTRAQDECAALEAAADFRAITGNPVMAGTTAPKLAWLAAHEPEAVARIAKVLLPKDYVRLKLTGEAMSDMSDSAGTLWMDTGARDWSDVLLAATGLDRSHMPALAEGSAQAGAVRPVLAERWGLSGAIPVAGGGGDNAASACGVGAVTPDSGFVSIGTSGVLFVSNAAFSPNTDRTVHAFCHAVPDTWHQMGVILSAADSLSWLSRITGRDAAALAGAADPAAVSAAEPLFLPYLSGERTPHNDGRARGAFIGLGQGDDVSSLARAVLEGVAFAFADSLDALRDVGSNPSPLLAVGGGARSDTWLQMIADALGAPLERVAGGEAGAALGAARLGLCAAEGAEPFEICTAPAIDRTFTPDAARAGAVAERLARWRAAWPAIAPVGRAPA